MKSQNIVIIGQGYVGLNISVAAASAGMNVVGFDINTGLISSLKNGISHVEGIESTKIKLLQESGRLSFSIESDVLEICDTIIIAVPTGLTENKAPDLSNLQSAVDTIIKSTRTAKLIINESTSYPGTLRNEIAAPISNQSNIKHLFASSPERVDPANRNWNLENTPRLLSGINELATSRALSFYEAFCSKIVVVDTPEVAEAAKLLENSFRLVNISFINEFSMILSEMDIESSAVIEAASTKPYGFMKFTASAGAGGHCIPVDPVYFQTAAKRLFSPTGLIDESLRINRNMPKYIVDKITRDHGGDLRDKNVIIVGVAYKPNVADTRETPAAEILNELQMRDAKISWHDPLVREWNHQTSSPITNQDIAIVLTKHDGYDYSALESITYSYDCRTLS